MSRSIKNGFVLSQNGINLIKSFEGLELQSYLDTGGVWTIGYGHTAGVTQGQTITEQQAEQYLYSDLQNIISKLNTFINSNKIVFNQNKFDACISLIFNIGWGAFYNSTLASYLKQKDYVAAGNQFTRWVYDNGQFIQSLYNRRLSEKNLYFS